MASIKNLRINGVDYTISGSGSDLNALETELLYEDSSLNLNSCVIKQGGEIIVDSNGNIIKATTNTSGGIKIGYTQNEKNYPIQLDTNGRAFVNVPWEGGSGTSTGIGTITGVSINGTSIATSGVADIPLSSTSQYGVTKLYSGVDSNDNTLAATAGAVKIAYDLAKSKTSNTGTITGVSINGTSIATSGVANIPLSSTSQYGATKLYSGVDSNENTLAATAGAVKIAYDLAKSKTSNVGTVTSITPGTGLTGTSSDAAITSSGTINLKPATTNEIGGVKFLATYNSGVTLATTGSNLDTRSYGLCCDQDGVAFVNVPWTDNDTKNTAGSSNSSSILYIIGATSQNSSGVLTYSNSNIKIQNNAVYASGGFFESSDERLKDFGEKVSVDLDKLSELKKNYFTWKDSENTEQQLGVSAQEIRELYPEIVSELDNGTLVVAYDKLSVIALAAIDELYNKNKELEKRLTALENKLK